MQNIDQFVFDDVLAKVQEYLEDDVLSRFFADEANKSLVKRVNKFIEKKQEKKIGIYGKQVIKVKNDLPSRGGGKGLDKSTKSTPEASETAKKKAPSEKPKKEKKADESEVSTAAKPKKKKKEKLPEADEESS